MGKQKFFQADSEEPVYMEDVSKVKKL